MRCAVLCVTVLLWRANLFLPPPSAGIAEFHVTASGSHVGVLIFQARERHSCIAAAEACNSRHDVNDADVGRALLRGPELLDPRAQERGELLLDIRHKPPGRAQCVLA